MIDYEIISSESILYKTDNSNAKKSVNYIPSALKGKMPKTKKCSTNVIDVDRDIAILREDIGKSQIEFQSQYRRKEFVINYAEGIRNMDMGNYSVAVACFEKALRYEPDNPKVQEYLVGALYAEMGNISKKMVDIRRRLNILSRGELGHKVRKCTIKMPIMAHNEIVPKGLLDSNGLINHFYRNTV
jgi:tetratricopeptide (TPR) repeat protein